MLTHVGLFEGSGIPSLAVAAVGIKTTAYSEVDPACCYALGKLWPDAIPLGSVTTADWSLVPQPVFILTAGVPCQPVSTAGKQKGDKDERWLWPETIRAVRELRPRWLLFENPSAIILHGLERIVAELEDLGYEFFPKGADGRFTPLRVGAWAVGAPHKRDRVWIVAHRRSDRLGSGQQRQQPVNGTQRPLSRDEPTWGSELLADANREDHRELVNAVPDGLRVSWRAESEGTLQRRDGTLSTRWPSRPGEPQHEFEFARLLVCDVGCAAPRVARWMDGFLLNKGDWDEKTRPSTIMRIMRETNVPPALREQSLGGLSTIPEADVLQQSMRGASEAEQVQRKMCLSQCEKRRCETGTPEECLRDVRKMFPARPSPQRRKPGEQHRRQPDDALQALPCQVALEQRVETEAESYLLRLWKTCEGQGIVPETFPAVQEIWRSLDGAGKQKASEGIAKLLKARLSRWNKQQLRAIGNSWCYPVAEIMFRAIVELEAYR